MTKIINNKSEISEVEYDKELAIMRHSASHVLAQAVKRLYPNVKLAIGPSVEDGFYYDFDNLDIKLEDLEKIEEEIKKVLKENQKTKALIVKKEKALKLMKDEPYKLELINELPEGEEISFYEQGKFVDMCRGPHVLYLKEVGHIKLLSVTGAYWKGSEKNKMLTRIYGTCFAKKEQLDEFVKQREEAKSRDHNKLGRELKLFTTVAEVGQGLPILLPKGAKVIQIMERLVEDEEEARGYMLTKTPYLAKSDLYKMSGHWDHYKDGMFILGNEEKGEEVFALRPMTCPFQFMAYKNEIHSYKELPCRYNETSTLFRNEASGEMHGLTRVRQFTIAEGHIVVRPDQIESEFDEVLNLINYFMSVLEISDEITYRFSKWDPNNTEKYINNPRAWKESQDKMRAILTKANINFEEVDGEAAFYGPKLDIQHKNVYGKEDTLITVQIDFALAERLGMFYIDSDGEKKIPFVIHRTSLGCYERTLAMLIEKYAGALPLWVAPVQIKLLPISENEVDYAKQVASELRLAGIRVEIDEENEKIGYKIRKAQLEKIPYMAIIGEKEKDGRNISIRSREKGDLGTKSTLDFIKQVLVEVKNQLRR